MLKMLKMQGIFTDWASILGPEKNRIKVFQEFLFKIIRIF